MGTVALRSLALVSHGYPCGVKPVWLVFVRQIAHAFARQGVQTSVICPLAIHRALLGRDAYQTVEDAGDGATVTVYRPKYFSMSSRKIGAFDTVHLSNASHWLAARRSLKRHLRHIDALYGHFLYPSGVSVVRLGREFGIPSFPAAGEISLDTIRPAGPRKARRDLEGATGIIANSTHMATLLRQDIGFGGEKVGVFPNAVDRRRFYPRDRDQMRIRWGLPRSTFIVACVGNYESRKGQLRVCQAIDSLPGVCAAFAGSGATPPEGAKVVFNRALPHEDVPELLSACDAFVLPTTDEGCCNAIIEAMACGLPVISSTGSFNDDILNESVSIRTDPLDVAAISQAIVRLRDDIDVRSSMARSALQWSEKFDADRRARRILEFMQGRINSSTRTIGPGGFWNSWKAR